MVSETKSGSPLVVGDRRIRFRILGGTWRNSWRNSDQTLESRDGCSKRGGESVTDETPSKSVRFPEELDSLVTEIPQGDDSITPEEIHDSWYHVSPTAHSLGLKPHCKGTHFCCLLKLQKEDYEKFEKDRVLTSYGYIASKRATAATFDLDKYSLRGLESLTDERLGKREIAERKALRMAIKTEELRQKQEKIFPDLSKFRSVCLKHTRGSRDRALAVAHEDAKFARKDKQEDYLSPLPRLRRKHSDMAGKKLRRASIG